MIFNVGVAQLKRVSFFKCNDNIIMCIDSFKDHSKFKISEQFINRQKLL